ncbi:MAG: hypothetical protein NC299_03630 [Lachnospiraceae bacterium]|nr:hypothetical protein [Lachnospiraceae bacterium]
MAVLRAFGEYRKSGSATLLCGLGCVPRFRRVSKERLGGAVMRFELCSALYEMPKERLGGAVMRLGCVPRFRRVSKKRFGGAVMRFAEVLHVVKSVPVKARVV